MNQTAKAPVHLWIIGIIALLWNCVGVMDYVLTKLQNRAYLEGISAPMGIDTDTAIAYFTGFPLWMNLAWAFGVWGAFAGSVLLLLRNRYAFHAFIVALFGLAVANYGQYFAMPFPGLTDTTVPIVFSIVIAVITAGLAWYCKAMTARGVLR
jgi:hypothetical protein